MQNFRRWVRLARGEQSSVFPEVVTRLSTCISLPARCMPALCLLPIAHMKRVSINEIPLIERLFKWLFSDGQIDFSIKFIENWKRKERTLVVVSVYNGFKR